MANTEVIHAYRHLYRAMLRAVMYTGPGRFIMRDNLRAGFRGTAGSSSNSNTLGTTGSASSSAGTRPSPSGPATFDAEAVKRTTWFFEAAAKETGLEHRIVKNLVKMHMQRGAADAKAQRDKRR